MTDTAKQTEEHPIIFNSWSIRRILAGEKTQTRRIVKPQPPHELGNALDRTPRYCDETTTGYLKNGPGWYWMAQTAVDEGKWRPVGGSAGCPYSQPGDVLWVREAFRLPNFAGNNTPSEHVSKFSHPDCHAPVLFPADDHAGEADGNWGRKRPSIHMPRELCRLRLRVKDVRVERVQEVNPGDAAAEGIKRKPKMNYSGEVVGEMNPVGGFKKLWNDIHGDGAWGENPWVWVIEFSRIDK